MRFTICIVARPNFSYAIADPIYLILQLLGMDFCVVDTYPKGSKMNLTILPIHCFTKLSQSREKRKKSSLIFDEKVKKTRRTSFFQYAIHEGMMTKLYDSMSQLEKENSQLKEKVKNSFEKVSFRRL